MRLSHKTPRKCMKFHPLDLLQAIELIRCPLGRFMSAIMHNSVGRIYTRKTAQCAFQTTRALDLQINHILMADGVDRAKVKAGMCSRESLSDQVRWNHRCDLAIAGEVDLCCPINLWGVESKVTIR